MYASECFGAGGVGDGCQTFDLILFFCEFPVADDQCEGECKNADDQPEDGRKDNGRCRKQEPEDREQDLCRDEEYDTVKIIRDFVSAGECDFRVQIE